LKAQQKVIEAKKPMPSGSPERAGSQQSISQYRGGKSPADLAKDMATANIFTLNPAYARYLTALANASAIKSTDKFIFTPEGVFPQLVFGGESLTPVVPVK
jgi:hypothetical protein